MRLSKNLKRFIAMMLTVAMIVTIAPFLPVAIGVVDKEASENFAYAAEVENGAILGKGGPAINKTYDSIVDTVLRLSAVELQRDHSETIYGSESKLPTSVCLANKYLTINLSNAALDATDSNIYGVSFDQKSDPNAGYFGTLEINGKGTVNTDGYFKTNSIIVSATNVGDDITVSTKNDGQQKAQIITNNLQIDGNVEIGTEDSEWQAIAAFESTYISGASINGCSPFLLFRNPVIHNSTLNIDSERAYLLGNCTLDDTVFSFAVSLSDGIASNEAISIDGGVFKDNISVGSNYVTIKSGIFDGEFALLEGISSEPKVQGGYFATKSGLALVEGCEWADGTTTIGGKQYYTVTAPTPVVPTDYFVQFSGNTLSVGSNGGSAVSHILITGSQNNTIFDGSSANNGTAFDISNVCDIVTIEATLENSQTVTLKANLRLKNVAITVDTSLLESAISNATNAGLELKVFDEKDAVTNIVVSGGSIVKPFFKTGALGALDQVLVSAMEIKNGASSSQIDIDEATNNLNAATARFKSSFDSLGIKLDNGSIILDSGYGTTIAYKKGLLLSVDGNNPFVAGPVSCDPDSIYTVLVKQTIGTVAAVELTKTVYVINAEEADYKTVISKAAVEVLNPTKLNEIASEFAAETDYEKLVNIVLDAQRPQSGSGQGTQGGEDTPVEKTVDDFITFTTNGSIVKWNAEAGVTVKRIAYALTPESTPEGYEKNLSYLPIKDNSTQIEALKSGKHTFKIILQTGDLVKTYYKEVEVTDGCTAPTVVEYSGAIGVYPRLMSDVTSICYAPVPDGSKSKSDWTWSDVKTLCSGITYVKYDADGIILDSTSFGNGTYVFCFRTTGDTSDQFVVITK